MIFQSIGIEIKKQPPFTPMMNSRMENFIRAIKTECLDKISLPMSGSFVLPSKSIWIIGITTVSMADLTGEWYYRIRRTLTARYKRFLSLVACCTVITE